MRGISHSRLQGSTVIVVCHIGTSGTVLILLMMDDIGVRYTAIDSTNVHTIISTCRRVMSTSLSPKAGCRESAQSYNTGIILYPPNAAISTYLDPVTEYQNIRWIIL